MKDSKNEWTDHTFNPWKDGKVLDSPHHTERVAWPCAKCGKEYRANCGLDISPEHGPVIPEVRT